MQTAKAMSLASPILPTVWRDEVCQGQNPTRVAKALDERGLLVAHDPARWTTAPRLSGHGTVRVYAVRGTILEDDDGE